MHYQSGEHFSAERPKCADSPFLCDACFHDLFWDIVMGHVFISYSRKDSETVDRIVARLHAENFTVWIDREEIHGGDLWREAIVEAVDNAYVFLLMLSPYSVESDNVRKEVDLAEGAGKALLPLLLAQSQLPARLRYQLAGIQWIEYYRDPDKKFNELATVLRGFQQKYGTVPPAATRQVEFVFNGLDLSKLDPTERQQLQEKLLEVVATSTNTSRSDLRVVTLTAGSVHIFVDMPARAAYQVKTAALNQDPELIRLGIDALRLAGDRDFIPLHTVPKPPPKTGKRGGPRGWMGGLILTVVLLISMVAVATALAPTRQLIASFFKTATFTPTNTYTLTPSNTPTATSTSTSTFTPTSTLTPTPTHTLTPTPTVTPSVTITPSITPTPTLNPPATFVQPGVSTNRFGPAGDACGAASDLKITLVVSDTDGVDSVQIYFRLLSKTSRATTPWGNLPMTFKTIHNPLFPFVPTWQIDITSNDIVGEHARGEYWFQFYFIAADKTGAQTQSPFYGDLVTYQECGFVQ